MRSISLFIFLGLFSSAYAQEQRLNVVPTQTSIVIREFKSIDVLPSELRKMAQVARVRSHAPVKVLFRETNDIIFSPVAVIAFLVDPNVGSLDAPNFDMGYTHGMELEVSQERADGINYSVRATTDLYTQATGEDSFLNDEGMKTIPIFFAEKNNFEASIDNFFTAYDQDDAVLWRAGIGIQILNHKNINSFGATGTQELFHHTFKANGKQPQYEYHFDGKGVRTSAFLDFAVGMSKTIAGSGRFKLRAQGSVEPMIFTDMKQTYVMGKSSLNSDMKMKKSFLTLKTGAETLVHGDGVQFTPVVELKYERASWGIESTVAFPTGDVYNNVDYNLTKRPYNSIAIYKFIGRKK